MSENVTLPDTITAAGVTLYRTRGGRQLITYIGRAGHVSLHLKETRFEDERERWSGWIAVYVDAQGGTVPEFAAGATPQECAQNLGVIVQRWRDAWAAVPR
jgi:hypothetical protein